MTLQYFALRKAEGEARRPCEGCFRDPGLRRWQPGAYEDDGEAEWGTDPRGPLETQLTERGDPADMADGREGGVEDSTQLRG